MTIFHAVLMLATFLCSLVAGFLFTFAAVVMPGIRSLDDGGFIRAFQLIDRVIQNNQPLFVFVWVGSVLALIAAAVLGIWALSGAVDFTLLGQRFQAITAGPHRDFTNHPVLLNPHLARFGKRQWGSALRTAQSC